MWKTEEEFLKAIKPKSNANNCFECESCESCGGCYASETKN